MVVGEGEPRKKIQKLSLVMPYESSSSSLTSETDTGTSTSQSSSGTSCSTCSSSETSPLKSRSSTHDDVACKAKVQDVSREGGNSASGPHVMRPSPTPGTTAVSARQMLSGMTSDGRIQFTESEKPSSENANPKSSRLIQRSSLADRSGARMHPYRPAAKTDQRRDDPFAFKKYEWHRDIEDLLQCHTTDNYSRRLHCQPPVYPRILIEVSRRAEEPAFQSYKFVRSTRANAQRILGETNVVDDLEDVPFTADDVKHFAEKKRMAEQLDKAIESCPSDSADS